MEHDVADGVGEIVDEECAQGDKKKVLHGLLFTIWLYFIGEV